MSITRCSHIDGRNGVRAMRVLAVSYLPPRPGGSSVSLGQLLAGMADVGVQIATVAPIKTETMVAEGDLYAARNPQLTVLRYAMPADHVKSYEPMPPEMAARENQQILRLGLESALAFQPDLLLAGHEFLGYQVRRLAAELRLPWCQMLRGSPTSQILSDRFPAERIPGYIEQLRAADRIIAVASFMASGLAARFGIVGIRTIPNAVDLRRFQPRPRPDRQLEGFGLDPRAPIVLVPGVLIDRKRPMDVLLAAEQIVRQQPDVRFIFAGSGDLEGELRAYAAQRGLADYVRFIGWTAYEDMPHLYNCADVVVMASDCEGMSRVYLEAMASGTTLVASDNFAARELIKDGRSGFLFPVGDAGCLAALLSDLLKAPQRRAEIGRNATRAVGDHGIERAVERYVDEFRSMLSRS